MRSWWRSLKPKLGEFNNRDDTVVVEYDSKLPVKEDALDHLPTALEYATERPADRAKDLHSFVCTSISATHPANVDASQRSLNLTLDIGSATYKDVNCI